MTNSVKILFNTFLKLDFRDRENSGKKKFFGILFSYLFANTVLSFNNYFALQKESYIIVSFSTGIFLLVFVLLNNFENLLFAKNHFGVIGTLPLKNSEIALSKFFSCIVYLSVYALIIVIPQVVLYCFYNTSLTGVTLFFFSGIFSLFFFTGIILFLYTISYKIFSAKSNIILYILQFVFFFYVVAISSLASGVKSGKTDLLSLSFVKYLPQYYFALSVGNPALLAILIVITIFLFVVFFFYLKRNYSEIFSIISESDKKNVNRKNNKSIFKKYNEFVCNTFIRNNEEKASYFLTLNLFSNSKSLKLKIIPLVFLPVIVTLIGIFTNTIVIDSFSLSAGSIAILSPSVTYTFIMCVRLIFSSTKVEDDNSPCIGWIFSSLPVLSVKRIQNANLKFIFANFVLSLVIVLLLLLSFRMEIISLILNIGFLLSSVLFVNSIFLYFDNIFPYSMENTKYNSVSKLGEVLYLILIGTAIFVAQIFIFENVIFVIIAILLFLIFSFLIKQRNFRLIKQ